MPKLTLTAGSVFETNAAALCLIRRLGQPGVVTARAATPLDGSFERWRKHRGAGPVQLSVDGVALPAPALLRGHEAPYADARGLLHLRAELTADQPTVHQTRRRVHRPNNLLEHIDALKVAVVPSAVAKRLQPVALGGGERAAIIQDGSDWSALGAALAEYARLEPDPPARGATLTGGTGPGTAGKWVVTWRDPRAYRNHDDAPARTIKFADGDGVDGEWGEPLPPWPPAPRAPLVECVARLFRTFDAGAWARWTTRDVPQFLDAPGGPQFVVGVIDELRWCGGIPAWNTALEVAPTGVGLPGPLDGIEPRAWSGAAQVLADTGTEPLIQVEVPGFEGGSNRFFARRTTPTDGKRGDGGQSRKVYAGALAQIDWSGRFDDEAVFDDTRRRRAAEAPNLESLDDDIVFRLMAAYVRACGDLNFDCALNVLVAQALKMRGRTATVASGGARVEVNEDHVNTVQ
jgi:hypothetical protein